MPNYVVRNIQTAEAVGLFAVRDVADLKAQVSRLTDPALCEYADVGADFMAFDHLQYARLTEATRGGEANDN